jgi:hypothetical protein
MNAHVEDIIPLATMLREYEDEVLLDYDKELSHIENRLRLLNNRIVGHDTVSDIVRGYRESRIQLFQAERLLKSLGLFQEEIDALLH